MPKEIEQTEQTGEMTPEPIPTSKTEKVPKVKQCLKINDSKILDKSFFFFQEKTI